VGPDGKVQPRLDEVCIGGAVGSWGGCRCSGTAVLRRGGGWSALELRVKGLCVAICPLPTLLEYEGVRCGEIDAGGEALSR